MRTATVHGVVLRRVVAISLFTAIAFAPVSSVYGQWLGPEAYLYGEVPVPAHIIADVYIEQKVLPYMLPELIPLWLVAKDSPEPVDKVINAYFLANPTSSPALELRDTYTRDLLLLKQLRNAIVIYEQIYITPDLYAAALVKNNILSAEEQTKFLAVAGRYVAEGDKPQAAALKAETIRMHEPMRQQGIFFFACYFENPQTTDHESCVREILESDRIFRDDWFRERFPLDEQTRSLLTDSFGDLEGRKWVWETVNVIDIIGLMLRENCPNTPYADVYESMRALGPATEKDMRDAAAVFNKLKAARNTCLFELVYRLNRPYVIRTALDGREDYQDATVQRQSQIEQDARLRAANHPLSGLFRNLAAGAAGIIVIAKMNQIKRAEANAANPEWKGHENDLWCGIHFDYDGRGYGREHTYCESFNGLTESADSVFNHCHRVNGWCESE